MKVILNTGYEIDHAIVVVGAEGVQPLQPRMLWVEGIEPNKYMGESK